MNLADFLDEKRDEYLKALQMMADKFSGHPEYVPFFEVLDERETHANAAGYSPSFFRHDLLLEEKDGTYFDLAVNISPITFTSPETCRLDGYIVVLESFVLNGCKIKLPDPSLNKKALGEWYTKWVKPDINQFRKEPVNAIHDLYLDEQGDLITVDFGTVQPSGIIELFDLLAGPGHGKLTISASYCKYPIPQTVLI